MKQKDFGKKWFATACTVYQNVNMIFDALHISSSFCQYAV